MTERRASQRERILAWALAGHVIHQDDWYNGGPDGAGPCKAVRSRISELETQEGYGFHHTRRADGTIEYRIAHVPEPIARPPARSIPAVKPEHLAFGIEPRNRTEPELVADVDVGEQLPLCLEDEAA